MNLQYSTYWQIGPSYSRQCPGCATPRDHPRRSTWPADQGPYGDISHRGHGHGQSNVIIGFNWLKQHNPNIDWQKGEITFSRCPPECK
ncbi:hypothetical protein B0H17DRAFT_946543 [Mycena rosella]|uniref:Uncharacterized protein n=1 Tax=Mycena rosella TaxID=1033263 RepID=A0AAD7D1J3_MYCRO|nr:hypothetical protein B0H17DRAFT_946543 [Mycena rosella]